MGCSAACAVVSQPPATAHTACSTEDRRPFLCEPAPRPGLHAYLGALRRMLRVGVRTAKTPAGFFAAAICPQSSSFLATLGSKTVSLQDAAAGFFAAAISSPE